MIENLQNQELAILVGHAFELDITSENQAKIKELLVSELIRLILNSPEKLWNILYRIDVNETKVKYLFSNSAPMQIAPELADLIIERMLQKAKSRLAYKKDNPNFDPIS
jgi:hypothetical protein